MPPPVNLLKRGGSNKESPSQATPHQLFRSAALSFRTAAATAPATAPPAPRRHCRPSKNPLWCPPAKKQPALAHAPRRKARPLPEPAQQSGRGGAFLE